MLQFQFTEFKFKFKQTPHTLSKQMIGYGHSFAKIQKSIPFLGVKHDHMIARPYKQQ